MATYSAVSATEKDPNSPITAALIDKLDQNPLAIIEGAPGAPKIQNGAFANNSISPQKLNSANYFMTPALSSNLVNPQGGGFYYRMNGLNIVYMRLTADRVIDTRQPIGILLPIGSTSTHSELNIFCSRLNNQEPFYEINEVRHDGTRFNLYGPYDDNGRRNWVQSFGFNGPIEIIVKPSFLINV